MAEIDGFEWVTEEQALRLAAGEWGDGWPERLRTELNAHYPGWEQAGDEDRQKWLTVLMPTIGVAGTDGVDAFGWVTDEQQAQLNELWEVRGDWRDWLPAELDTHWPEWRQSTPDVVGPWLDGLIPGLVLPGDVGDPAALDWLTAEHRTQLNELWEIRGDWSEWLPAELDSRWPEWRRSTSEVLGPWLDGLIPGLVMPFDVDDILEKVAAPALAELYAELPALAEELGMTPDELAAEIDGLPSEFFTEILLEEIGAG